MRSSDFVKGSGAGAAALRRDSSRPRAQPRAFPAAACAASFSAIFRLSSSGVRRTMSSFWCA